jgi:hypothetical protein
MDVLQFSYRKTKKLNMNISDVGKLNGLCKDKNYFWGIKKNSWEDFYLVEVSSNNFDNRPSFHEKFEYIDDAFLRMKEFAEKQGIKETIEEKIK